MKNFATIMDAVSDDTLKSVYNLAWAVWGEKQREARKNQEDRAWGIRRVQQAKAATSTATVRPITRPKLPAIVIPMAACSVDVRRG